MKPILMNIQIVRTMFIWLKVGVFTFQNHRKNLDPSYKTDLEFCDCFGG